MKGLCAAVIAAAITTTGCATVAHQHIPDDEADRRSTGVRYYATSPYLLVYSNGKGGIITELKYLPDPAKKMAAAPAATLANVEATLTFDRGVLTSAVTKGDATAVPTAIVKAVETIAPALLAALNEAATEKELIMPAPHIYKVVVNGTSVSFRGGKGDADFKVTLLPQEPKGK
jgi:hypothetical protein